MTQSPLEQAIDRLEEAVTGLDGPGRTAVLDAVADVIEAVSAQSGRPWPTRGLSTQGTPAQQQLQTVVNRLRDSAARGPGR